MVCELKSIFWSGAGGWVLCYTLTLWGEVLSQWPTGEDRCHLGLYLPCKWPEYVKAYRAQSIRISLTISRPSQYITLKNSFGSSRRGVSGWVELVTISYPKKFCTSGNQTLISHILEKHHATSPSRHLTTVTFTLQGKSMSLWVLSSEITFTTKCNSGSN